MLELVTVTLRYIDDDGRLRLLAAGGGRRAHDNQPRRLRGGPTRALRYRHTRRYRATCRYTHRYADGQRSEGLQCALVSSTAA